jgi:hypothetical protein
MPKMVSVAEPEGDWSLRIEFLQTIITCLKDS